MTTKVSPKKSPKRSLQVTQEPNAKLLGLTIDDNLDWSTQILGTGGVISALNSRLYLLKRLSSNISKDRLRRVADSLYTSKIRYGLQLFGAVRITNEQPTQALMNSLQLAQNRCARFLNGNRLNDRVSTKSTLNELKMLSVNQINAQIKLYEVWKSLQTPTYPTQWEIKKVNLNMKTRSSNSMQLSEPGLSNVLCSTFISDAARLWNLAPDAIKNSPSVFQAKKNIRSYVSTLPI